MNKFQIQNNFTELILMMPFTKIAQMVTLHITKGLLRVALWSPAGKRLTSWLSCVMCFVTFPKVSWSTSELRARLAPWNWFKPSSKIFYWLFQGGTSFVDLFLFGSFMFLFYLVFVMSLCVSVYMCFVVTCWERADLLALVCGVCEFATFPLVSWVRCCTTLYWFLIFAPLLTLPEI